jgi:hypothetical protein
MGSEKVIWVTSGLKLVWVWSNFIYTFIFWLILCLSLRKRAIVPTPYGTSPPVYLKWSMCYIFFFMAFFIIIRYFLYLHFKCYPESSLYPTPPPPSYPPTLLPWRSPVLGHIKFARPRGLFSQWWPARPSSATYAARDTNSGDTG